MARVVGVGAGGHAKVVVDILIANGSFEIIGLLDANPSLWNAVVAGLRVLGDDELLSDLHREGVQHAFIGVGSLGNVKLRKRLYAKLLDLGFQLVDAIHPRAVVAPSVRFGRGPTVMAAAVINAAARLGDNVIINTGAVVEHDCVISDHVHVATGACLAGTVTVGEAAHVGLGACVREGLRIGVNAVVGAGAVVVSDVPDNVVVAGVPARVLKTREP